MVAPQTPPFFLKVLGGASIEGPDGPVTGRAAQRHRLALLALLATNPDGLTRDKLVGLLWPERSPARARHALSDSIYRVNQALGRDAVVAVGNRDLRLDHLALPSDVAAFLRALEIEDWERADDIWGGPFLDGFHLPGSVEFERWVDAERHRLSRRFAGALEALAGAYGERGEPERAVAAWRRRAALDRYDSRVAMRLMESLVAAGNPAAALRHARVHAQLLEREFGTGPDPDVSALAEEIRSGDASSGRERAGGRSDGAMRSEGTDEATVDRVVGATSDRAAGAPTPEPLDVGAADGRGGWWTGGLLAAVLVGLWLAGSLTGLPLPRLDGRFAPDGDAVRLEPVGAAVESRTIAVLPFEDLSANGDQRWFADGLAEEITHALVPVQGLDVIARQSSFAFRDRPLDVRHIANALGVDYVVDGSVRRGGDSAWISAQLTDGTTGIQRWSSTWATTPSSERLHAIQNRVAREVATALSLRLRETPAPPPAMPGDRAYDLYLEGRYLLRSYQSGASSSDRVVLSSIDHLQRVAEEEPDWAPGWAALGEAYHWAAFAGVEPTRHRMAAKEALERALDLDPTHAQANASLGYVLHRLDHDYESAELYLRRALELDSEQYWHCGYSLFLLWAERYDEAVEATRRSEGYDPMFWPLKVLLAMTYRCAGRFEDAVRQAKLALSEKPNKDAALRELALALERSGRAEQALAVLDLPVESHPYLDLVRALVLARNGRGPEADSLLRGVDLEQEIGWAWPSRTLTAPSVHAAALVALGRADSAIAVLQAAMERDGDTLLYDRCYPELRELEGDPRYEELLEQTGVPR